ncbi:MAG: hypothetical protein LBJ75_03225, partial [Puniceicoccales bacterium]|nr:hypothetical protein [Puniceicoccales bacterium]
MNIDALSIRNQPSPAVVSPLQNIVPPMISNEINLDTLLRDTSRTKNHTPGNGHNNCAFNAVLEQVGNRTSNSEMVNLLRSSLGYANENSGTMLWSTSCSDIASLFRRPVIVIEHNNRNQITEVSLCVLSTEAGLP